MTKKTKSKAILKFIGVPIFERTVIFAHGATFQEFTDFVKKHKCEERLNMKELEQYWGGYKETLNAHAYTVNFENEFILLNMCDISLEKLDFFHTLVHEIVHVVMAVFRKANLKHNKHTDEVFAYLSDFLFAQIIGNVYNFEDIYDIRVSITKGKDDSSGKDKE